MASTASGFEDRIPPLSTMLAGGIPSTAALDTYLADLDLDLEENQKELDNCLHDMLKLTNTIVGKEYVTPRDALLSMISNHVLEKSSCYDPDSDSVTDILAHAATMIETVPGCEEAVLQDLLSLSSQQGLMLPLKSTVVDPIASTMSLNAVSDSSELQIAQQWDHLALHLRRYFLDKLSQLPVGPRKPEMDITEGRRLRYLQSLISLQPMEDIWDRYQALRKKQIERCLGMLLPEAEAENLDVLELSNSCDEIAAVMIRMMSEDFSALNSGLLKKPPNIFQAFHKVYLEKYSDEMSALIDEVWDEMRDLQHRGPSHSFSAQGSKGKGKMSKASSTSLLRKQAHSLENMTTTEKAGEAEEETEDRSMIPMKHMQAMLNIVKTIQRIEEHVDNLQRASIWDVGGLTTKKLGRKGSLKGVLKPRSSPEPQRRPNSANLSSMDSDAWMSDSVVSSHGSVSSMGEPPPGPKVTVIEKMKMEEKMKWDWKIIFKKISPQLAKCVEQCIQSGSARCLQEAQEEWSRAHTLQTMDVPAELWGGRLDYPKVIPKAVGEFMNQVELFAPFAKAGVDGTLNTVKSSFLDATNACLKNFHAHLMKLSADIPLTAPMKNLYLLLSGAAYIRNLLLHFDTVLSPEDSKKPFGQLYKQFVELVEALTEVVVQRHNNYLGTSILHDTESHNWTENKEFYEGERCSFPIQMWNYYLRGVQNDLWSVGPPKLAQSVISILLHDSLQILTQRYTRARPSYRRVQQFRCDIQTILLCVFELLFMSSNSISKCLDAGHSQMPHYAIHNLCTTLMASMAVIVSPLDVLYKVNKKGYRYRQKRKSYSSADRGCNTHWLSWIQPSTLDKMAKNYDGMRTTVAVYFHTKLLLCQPELNYPLTLQAYLMKDYTLSILFLIQAVSLYNKNTKSSSQSKDNPPTSKQKAISDSTETFTRSLIRVLSRCAYSSDALCKVIVPVIERCDDWSYLDMKHVPGRDGKVPLWLQSIFCCLTPFVQRIVKPVVEHVLSHMDQKHITPVAVILEELPCGCRSHATLTPRSSRKSEERDLVDTVLRLVVHQMTEDIFVLPTSVCVLFKAMEEECISRSVKTPHHCVGLKLLALALREYLLDTPQLEEHLGMNLSPDVRENLSMLADCIYHIIVSGKVKGSTTPRLAGKFCKDNKDWVNDKLQLIIRYINHDMFEVTENALQQGAPTEFLDHLYVSMISDILTTSTGKEDLTHLYWMIHNNQVWLHNQLDIKLTLPLARNKPDTQFVVSLSAKKPKKFDPLKEFQKIGPCKFDHTAIEAMTIDWEKLLQSDLGLSDLGFRGQLYNRHELQDGAYLEENEKKPVANLKAVFENEPQELS